MKKFRGKETKNFEDRTGFRIDQAYLNAPEPRRRIAKTAGENDTWVPIKDRNGYHRSKLGKSQ